MASAALERCCDRHNNEGVSLLQATQSIGSVSGWNYAEGVR